MIRRHTRSKSVYNDMYSELFNFSPLPLIVADFGSKKIHAANEAASQLYGYSIGELNQLTMYDLRPESEHERLSQYLRRFPDGKKDNGVWLHRDSRGRKFYVHVFSRSIQFRGKSRYIMCPVDINDRLEAEADYTNLVSALDHVAGLCVMDQQGDIIEVNAAFQRMTGYNTEELEGQSIDMLESDLYTAEQRQYLRNRIEKGETFRSDIRFRNKSGEVFWMDIAITPVYDRRSEVYRYLMLGYEVNDRKQLEERQYQMLQSFSEYAYLTSHKLRGPLARLLGLTGLSEKNMISKDLLVEKIKETSIELDEVIREMNARLYHDTTGIMNGNGGKPGK